MRFAGWKSEGLVVVAILILATALRVWRLDYRPLSTDEVLTALISIGRTHHDVRIGEMWPLVDLSQLLTPVYGLSWGDISRTLGDPDSHHAHPPLLYWVLYGWIHWIRPLGADLVFALRILPAIFGTVVVGLIYGLARTSVSRNAAIVSALLMAVSPIGVSMSQDARNYTLPLIFVTAALWALAAILIRSTNGRPVSWALWAGWAGANALSCYAHYLSILSIVAQAVVLVILVGRGRMLARSGLWLVATAVACAPLAQTLLQDYTRVSLKSSDNEWMSPRGLVDPLREAVHGWASMVGPTPNEFMPHWMTIATILIVVVMGLAVAMAVPGGIRRMRSPESPAVVMLALFSAVVFGELLVIVYGLEKDLFRYPRYQFMYFPAILVLIAAGLVEAGATVKSPGRARRLGIAGLLIAGLAGSAMRAYGYGTDDAFNSRRVASQIISAGGPALIVMGGDSFLTTAMGLAIAREIVVGVPGRSPEAHWFGYVPWASKTDRHWPGALTVAGPVPPQAWLIHRPPDTDFPPAIEVQSPVQGQRVTCTSGAEGLRRSGLEYQRYQCPAAR